jgi:hypothetical protein
VLIGGKLSDRVPMRRVPKYKLTDADRTKAGLARAANLTPEQRSESARHAAKTRHARNRALKRIGSSLRKAAQA